MNSAPRKKRDNRRHVLQPANPSPTRTEQGFRQKLLSHASPRMLPVLLLASAPLSYRNYSILRSNCQPLFTFFQKCLQSEPGKRLKWIFLERKMLDFSKGFGLFEGGKCAQKRSCGIVQNVENIFIIYICLDLTAAMC